MDANLPFLNQNYIIMNPMPTGSPQFETFNVRCNSIHNHLYPMNEPFQTIKIMYVQSTPFTIANNQSLNLFPSIQNNNFNQEMFNSLLLSVNKYQLPVLNSQKNENFNNSFVKPNARTPRKKFTDAEDALLRQIVKIFGPSNWRIISKLVPGRTPRQCRDRYTNYLAPGLVRIDWSDEEDKLLAEKYELHGPQWTLMKKFFPNRSPNDIKNRYNYTVCRKLCSHVKSDTNEQNVDCENLNKLQCNDEIFDFDLMFNDEFNQKQDFNSDNDEF